MTIFFSPFKKNIDSLIAAIAGFILVLILTSHSGIGISPDSIMYTSVARNFHAGKGWFDFTQKPLVDFPIFYPTFLSVFIYIFHTDVLQFAPILNATLFALVIFFSGYIIEQFIRTSKWYKWALLSIIAFSPSLLEIYTMLWSETLFILLTLLFFITIKKYYTTQHYLTIIILGLIAATATITRYAGITLLATGILVLLTNFSLHWYKRGMHIVLFVAISFFIPYANIVRNVFLTGNLAGNRLKGNMGIDMNISYFGSVIFNWFSGSTTQYILTIIVGLIILFGPIIVYLQQIESKKYALSYEKILTAFFLVYSNFIVISSTLSRYETINNRLLSPAYIPFILVFSHTIPYYRIPYWVKREKNRKINTIIHAAIMLALFIGFQYYQYKTNAETYNNIKDDGIPGYAEDVWKNSPIVHFIQTDTLLNKHYQKTYSNQNYAVYLFTGYGTETIPEKVRTEQVEKFYTDKEYYIIWFFTDENPDLLTIDDIKKHTQIKQIKRFEDGAIYYCNNNITTIKP